jgi:hypothetical protein
MVMLSNLRLTMNVAMARHTDIMVMDFVRSANDRQEGRVWRSWERCCSHSQSRCCSSEKKKNRGGAIFFHALVHEIKCCIFSVVKKEKKRRNKEIQISPTATSGPS